jgi:hypothetical protein
MNRPIDHLDHLAAHNPVQVSELGDTGGTPEAVARLERILGEPRARVPRWRRPRTPVRLWPRLVAPLASGAAVALVVALVNSGGAPPPREREVSARDVLLAAATRTEKTPAASGRYWHSRVRSMWPTEMLLNERRIGYEAMCDSDVWAARRPSDKSWWIVTSQSTRLLTPADERAWREEGKPELGSCMYGHGSTTSTQGFVAPYATELRDPGRTAPYVGFPSSNGKTISFRAVDRLPADPEKLREILAGWSVGPRPPDPVDEKSRSMYEYTLFLRAGDLLFALPTSPKVRAALYRMLAGFSSVRLLGEVRDPLGRTGQGIALANCRDGFLDRLILDERTGGLLALQEVQGCGSAARIKEWKALQAAEWTDESPRLPKNRTAPK